jgi:hypothetical protein
MDTPEATTMPTTNQWGALREKYAALLKGLNYQARECMEQDDQSKAYWEIVEIFDNWYAHDLSPEILWLGIQEILLESSAADIDSYIELSVNHAYDFLKKQNWLGRRGPWSDVAGWTVGTKISNLAKAKIAHIHGKHLFVDVETTGLSPQSDRIISIEWAYYLWGNLIQSGFSLVNPGTPIAPEVEAITGITNANVELAPEFVVPGVDLARLADDAIVISDNADFAFEFLKAECGRANIEFNAFHVVSTYALGKEHSFKGCLQGARGIPQNESGAAVDENFIGETAVDSSKLLAVINPREQKRIAAIDSVISANKKNKSGPTWTTLSMSAMEFRNNFVSAVRASSMERFRRVSLSPDILVVDFCDDFFNFNESTKEFIEIVRQRMQNNKPTVMGFRFLDDHQENEDTSTSETQSRFADFLTSASRIILK